MILAEITKDTVLSFISLVKKPANERDGLKLSADEPLKLSINEERMEVTSAVLIPNQRIYRNADFFEKTLGLSEDGEIYFSADSIKSIGIEYLNTGNRINLEHDEVTDKVQIVENWYINTEEDKTYGMGLSREDFPQGTWMQTQKITDMKLWEECKAGIYNGFSVQANPVLNVISDGLSMSTDFTEQQLVDAMVSAFEEISFK